MRVIQISGSQSRYTKLHWATDGSKEGPLDEELFDTKFGSIGQLLPECGNKNQKFTGISNVFKIQAFILVLGLVKSNEIKIKLKY